MCLYTEPLAKDLTQKRKYQAHVRADTLPTAELRGDGEGQVSFEERNPLPQLPGQGCEDSSLSGYVIVSNRNRIWLSLANNVSLEESQVSSKIRTTRSQKGERMCHAWNLRSRKSWTVPPRTAVGAHKHQSYLVCE